MTLDSLGVTCEMMEVMTALRLRVMAVTVTARL